MHPLFSVKMAAATSPDSCKHDLRSRSGYILNKADDHQSISILNYTHTQSATKRKDINEGLLEESKPTEDIA